MRRWLSTLAVCAFFGLSVLGCTTSAATSPTSTDGAQFATGAVVATSSIPTSTPLASAGNAFPVGTLILMQSGSPLAQLPTKETVSMGADRLGDKGSPNGQYGVRAVQGANNTSHLALVDYKASQQGQTTDIPQTDGISTAVIRWKRDSTGFAFSAFPEAGSTNSAAIFYYDIAGNKTSQLASPGDAKTAVTPIAFSPDGKYLVYALAPMDSEAIGTGKVSVLDTSNDQSTALPADAGNFNQWLRDSRSFVAVRRDAKGNGQVLLYSLDSLNSPKTLTPADASDQLVDVSPDGKYIVVTSRPIAQATAAANIFIMKLDGSGRKQLTQFTDVEKPITALIWGNDGIYYSVYGGGANTPDTTFRMDLDGSNPTQVAQGTLNGIIGA